MTNQIGKPIKDKLIALHELLKLVEAGEKWALYDALDLIREIRKEAK